MHALSSHHVTHDELILWVSRVNMDASWTFHTTNSLSSSIITPKLTLIRNYNKLGTFSVIDVIREQLTSAPVRDNLYIIIANSFFVINFCDQWHTLCSSPLSLFIYIYKSTYIVRLMLYNTPFRTESVSPKNYEILICTSAYYYFISKSYLAGQLLLPLFSISGHFQAFLFKQ